MLMLTRGAMDEIITVQLKVSCFRDFRRRRFVVISHQPPSDE
jgi:hypothetical protein